MIKKIVLSLLLSSILTISAGCETHTDELVTEEPQQQTITESGDEAESDSGIDADGVDEVDENEDIPIHEYTEEEKALLAIDLDKINGVFMIGWHLNSEGDYWAETDDLGALKTRYPDLELTYDEQKWDEWYSKTTGFY